MKSIDKLICDVLARRRHIVLPEVGTLESKRRRAKRISETEIIPPQNVVVFSPEEAEGTETAISLIAADRNIPHGEAVALYGSWLEGARRAGGSIAIDGAGEIRDDKFVVSPELDAALNPEGEEPVAIEARKKRGIPAWVWIAIVIVVALAVFFALRCCKPDLFGGSPQVPSKETVVTTPAPAADSFAAASPDSAAPAAPATTAPVSAAGRFHVIAGAFAVEDNADKFVAKVKREHPELTPVKLPHPRNGYMMVSIWQAPTEREARGKMNLYWDVNLSLWIYEQK